MLRNSVLQMYSSLNVLNHHNNMTLINMTMDVISKGCFVNYDQTACVRNGILSSIIFCTFLHCVVRVARLHWLQHPQLHQYLIFYLASLETCILGIKWLIGSHLPQLEFAAIYLKLIQFILLCHFHWTLATRILHREKLVSWCILPTLIVFAVYFTLVSILGIIQVKSSWVECLEPHWLLLSLGEFLVVQMFMGAGISITKKINTVSAIESFKREQKRDLWSVIVAYEFAALTSVIYDATIKIAGTEEKGCSGIYHHMQALYTPVLVTYVLIRFLLPVWAMIIVYQPIQGPTSGDEERLLSWTIDSPGSTFAVPIHHGQNIYKQLRQPGSENELGGSPPILPTYTTLTRGSSAMSPGYVTGILRRTILTPITEEETCSQLSNQDNDCKFTGLGGLDDQQKLNSV